jgi:hypothetical protein
VSCFCKRWINFTRFDSVVFALELKLNVAHLVSRGESTSLWALVCSVNLIDPISWSDSFISLSFAQIPNQRRHSRQLELG